MTGIQLLLLTGIIFIGLYFLVRLRKSLLDLVLILLMLIIAIVFIIRPDITITIARWLGVGRGADLVFYISIVLFWYVVLKLYVRIRRLEETFTEIIRHDAVNRAQKLPDDK